MRILVSHFGIKGKGGWGRTFMLAEGLAKLGNKVILITSIKSSQMIFHKKETKNNLIIIAFPYLFGKSFVGKGFGFFSLFLKLCYVSVRKFDIVHSDAGHRPQSGWPSKWNRILYKSKYITEWWDFFGKGGQYENKSKLFKILLGQYEIKSEVNDKINADGVVTLSEFMKNRAISLGIDGGKITIIHGGANVEYLDFHENNVILKKEYGISSNSLTFGYIGMSNGELEDLNPFIQAFNQLKNEININWFAVGKKLTWDTKKKYNIGDKFYEFGWIDFFNNSRILGCADIFVLLKEPNVTNIAGWPNKLGDYLACGRPVLLNLYGDVEQFTKNSIGSFYITNRSVKNLISKIRLIHNNKNSLLTEGKKNRLLAEESLSWSIKSKDLENFYKKILVI